jgi:hypothetical protein
MERAVVALTRAKWDMNVNTAHLKLLLKTERPRRKPEPFFNAFVIWMPVYLSFQTD